MLETNVVFGSRLLEEWPKLSLDLSRGSMATSASAWSVLTVYPQRWSWKLAASTNSDTTGVAAASSSTEMPQPLTFHANTQGISSTTGNAPQLIVVPIALSTLLTLGQSSASCFLEKHLHTEIPIHAIQQVVE